MSFLHLRLVEAVGLACTDLSGFSDPYCKIYFHNVSRLSQNDVYISKTKKKTTDPLWNESNSFKLHDKDFANGSLHIDIYDNEKASKKHDFLGGGIFQLSYFQSHQSFQGWIPVRSKNSARENAKKSLLNTRISQNSSNSSNTSPADSNSNITTYPGTNQPNLKKAGTYIGPSTSSFIPATNMHSQQHSEASIALNSHKFVQFNNNNNNAAHELALNIAHHDSCKTGSTLPKFGKRDTESGRLYIVLAFQKSFHFGGQSDAEINSKRERLLRIVQNPENNFPLRIYTATFNAGNTVLMKIKDSFSQWLPINKQIDLYVIGFQELHTKISKSHSTHNLSTNDEQKSDSDDIAVNVYGSKLKLDGANTLEADISADSMGVANEVIQDSQLMMNDEERMLFELDLNQQKEMEYHFMTYFGEEYEMIGSYKMWQTRLFIVTKKKYLDQISDVTKHFHRTGIGGVGKNKGAVGISFDFDGISLCFVCSHLAAHQTQSKARNAQYRKICHNLRVGWPKQQLLGQFHHLFWMGDLNYRVNVNGVKQQDTPSDNVWILYMNDLQIVINGKNGNPNGYCKTQKKKSVEREVNVYARFLENDQLMIAQQNDDVFVGFEEQDISFPPTFKVERETGLCYVQQRLPAWTDRILIRSATGFQNKCLYYRSYPAVNISDHKPVAAEFVIGNWHRSGCMNDICVKCEVHFRNMSGVNLIAADVNGKSDPFLHFPRQLLLEKYVKFDKCKKTLNPKWKNSHLKVLPLIRNSLEFLEKALLLFQVRDWDRFTGNDLIACGFLPLYPIACEMNSWKKFDVSLTLDGLKAGQIHGEFKLVYRM